MWWILFLPIDILLIYFLWHALPYLLRAPHMLVLSRRRMPVWATLIGAVTSAALCSFACAQEPSLEEYAAWRQLSVEHIDCSEFYDIVGICLELGAERENDKRLAEGVERAMTAGRAMLDRAVEISAKAKLKSEAVDAEAKLSMDSMMKEVGNDCGNLSILIVKYSETCKRLFENPKLREFELIAEELHRSFCLLKHKNPC